MSRSHTNDGPMDEPLDAADLGAELRRLAPGPGPGFWATVDARLAAAAPTSAPTVSAPAAEPSAPAAPTAAGTAPAAEPSAPVVPTAGTSTERRSGGAATGDDDTSDTEVTVVRLTPMTTHRANRFRSPRTLLTAAAAAVLVVAAAGATLAALRPDAEDVGVAAVSPDAGDGSSTGTGTGAGPGEDTGDGSGAGIGAGAGAGAGPANDLPTLGPTDQRLGAGTYCYRADDLSGDGNAAVLQLDVDAVGVVSAIEVPDPRAGVGPIAAAGWFVNHQDMLMQTFGEPAETQIWTVLPDGLQVAEDVFYITADCAVVSPTTGPVSVAAAVRFTPGSGPAPGRRCFAADSGPVEGSYQVDVDDTGQISVVSRIFDDGELALVMTGIGFAVSPTDLVLVAVAVPDETTLDAGVDDDTGQPATVWTMTDDTLGFGLGLTAAAVNCEGAG